MNGLPTGHCSPDFLAALGMGNEGAGGKNEKGWVEGKRDRKRKGTGEGWEERRKQGKGGEGKEVVPSSFRTPYCVCLYVCMSSVCLVSVCVIRWEWCRATSWSSYWFNSRLRPNQWELRVTHSGLSADVAGFSDQSKLWMAGNNYHATSAPSTRHYTEINRDYRHTADRNPSFRTGAVVGYTWVSLVVSVLEHSP